MFYCHVSESEFILAFWLGYLGPVFQNPLVWALRRSRTTRMLGCRSTSQGTRIQMVVTGFFLLLPWRLPAENKLSTLQVQGEKGQLHLQKHPDTLTLPTPSRQALL